MRYPLEKLSGCCFFKGLIRHLIIWKTLHFKALTQICFLKFFKERWRKGFVFLFLITIEYHPNNYIIE